MIRQATLPMIAASLLSATTLIGCTSDLASSTRSSETAEPTQAPTVASSSKTPSQPPVPTLTPSEEPTSLPSVTPAYMSTGEAPPLPDEFPGDFLFGVGTPDCQLPCWLGLRVGSSNKEEVYAVLDTALGLEGYRAPPPEDILEQLPDGLDAIWYGWQLESTSGEFGSYGVIVYFARESGAVEGLSFGWLGINRFQPYMTIERILGELGEPTYMVVNSRIGGPLDAPNAEIRTLIFYEPGLTFYRFEQTPVTELRRSSDGTMETIAANLCLGDNDPRSNGGAYITAPLTNGIDNLSELHDFLFSRQLATFVPIESIADVTLQEITELAVQQNNACIRLDLLQFYP